MQWMSDIHLNFLETKKRKDFYSTIGDADVLITGDIAESHNIGYILREMKRNIPGKIYFVAGNHDYYGSSISKVKKKLARLKSAYYLPKSDGVWLNKETKLVGEDGWGDTRNGDFTGSRLTMADWIYIKEFNTAYMKMNLRKTLMEYADKDAAELGRKVYTAIQEGAKKIIIATHVPPFEEACLYAGKKSTPGGLPFFSSQILGATILPMVEDNPGIEFLWLCGHTHSGCILQKRINFTVRVAEATYYFPTVEEI